MRLFRKNVALAVDGGGIKGIMVTRALAMLEQHMGVPVHTIFRLATGTSTGAIIAASLGAGLSAERIFGLYRQLGRDVFRRNWRSCLWPLTRYRYTHAALERALKTYIGDIRMGDLWAADPSTDVVITVFDLVAQRTRFVKSWKSKYARWPVKTAVLASCSIPTYFPVVNGRYVDGGVGSYANPCYLAAYEARFCLGWDPAETTLISLGTGRDPHDLKPGDADRFWVWDWINPVLGAFLQSADDQQVRLVQTFFSEIDFRRFQIDCDKALRADDPKQTGVLIRYGEELGNKILEDRIDWAVDISAGTAV
jgi:predicted acylesterase/phospholipase RssA